MSSEKTLAVMAITGIIPMSTNPEHQVQIYGPDVPIRILGKVVEVKFKISVLAHTIDIKQSA